MRDKILANKRGMLLKMFDGSDLARSAIARFPDWKAQLMEGEDQIHGVMRALGMATVHAVRERKLVTLLTVWSFLEEVLSNPRAHPEITNAVQISFVTEADLSINSTSREALDKMPERLKRLVAPQYPAAS